MCRYANENLLCTENFQPRKLGKLCLDSNRVHGDYNLGLQRCISCNVKICGAAILKHLQMIFKKDMLFPGTKKAIKKVSEVFIFFTSSM